MIYLLLFILLISSAVTITCAIRSNDLFQTILFVNTSTSIIAVFMCVLGTFPANAYFLDIAIIYFLLGVVANLAYMKYYMLSK
jgi:multisubunit Na+/H+ antiporter MnhF subunit